MTTREVPRIAATLAFRFFLAKSLRKHTAVARVMNLTPSSFSRTVNFKRDIKFVEVWAFCDLTGISISEIADLTWVLAKDPVRLQQIKDAEHLPLVQRNVGYEKVLVSLLS